MKFIPLTIRDVILIEPNLFKDARGYFCESYRENLFHERGIKDRFVQDNNSASERGVLRGLHYQRPPKAQAKLISVLHGSIFDVAVDIRKNSTTFGKYVVAKLSSKEKNMLYIPAGFAHGFCALEDETEVLYKVSDYYSPQDEGGILWNDPAIGIPWPDLKTPYLFSEKDQKYPTLKNAKVF